MESILKLNEYTDLCLPRVILTDYNTSVQNMKNYKPTKQKDFVDVDDENVRYKINTKKLKQNVGNTEEDEIILYKFPEKKTEIKVQAKINKPKSKTKVKFWTGKKSLSRLENLASKKDTNRRHTIATNANDSTGAGPSTIKESVSKNLCLMPSSQFTHNHIPMVTVPDDLIINLNETGLSHFNGLRDDINDSLLNGTLSNTSHSTDTVHNTVYDNELEYFSKYVVQKLRNMETNQRIFAENLVNSALMLGQLGKLNIKSKIVDS